MKTSLRVLCTCVLWSAAVVPVFVTPVRAEIPAKLEHIYAEAVLAFNSKDYPKSIAALDELLKNKPGLIEALELKALNLKAQHQEAASAEVYQELIRAKLAEGKTPRDVAAYRYELGLIRFRENNLSEAREQLQAALQEQFNAAACHFFLGLMDFRSNQLGGAESHFKETASSNVAELKPAADLYLGQIYSRLSRSSNATQRFFSARNAAKDLIDDDKADPESKKVAGQILDAAEKALRPFDRSGFFGNVGFTVGYDTNALSVPTTQISIDPTTGDAARTLKTMIMGGVGYMTSPLNSWQIVPSYRATISHNFNEEARRGEFTTNDLSVFITRNALARTSWGFKLQGLAIFQNGRNSDDPEAFFGYGLFSVVTPVGTYIRHELGQNWLLSAEINVAPQFYTDDSDDQSTFKRSGVDLNSRISLRNERGSRFWNPTYTVLLDSNQTQGKYTGSEDSMGVSGAEFTSKTLGFELANVMRLTEGMNLNVLVSASYPNYDQRRDGPRQDRLYIFGLGPQYRLTPKMTLLGDIQYVYNGSSVDSLYQFARFVVSLGASYTF